MGSPSGPAPVAIALGSNLGERDAHLREALTALSTVVDDLVSSTFHDTAPVGVGTQPRFLNAAVIGTSTLDPDALLAVMLAIEARLGRTRPFAGAPRTIDLDVILYGDTVLTSPSLVLPHPRFREREFVLAPLSEIAPDWRDPVTGATVRELLAALRHADPGERSDYGEHHRRIRGDSEPTGEGEGR